MSLRAALLGLLAEGPASGYELIRDFDVAASVIWPAPKGEIYRELARLQAQGLAKPDDLAGPRNKRTWRITREGRAELKRWLLAEADYSLRYEPMLKAVFLDTLTAQEVAACLIAQRQFFRSELAKLKAVRKMPPRQAAAEGRRRYGLPMAIRFYEAMVAWCDAALAAAEEPAAARKLARR